MFCVCFRYEAAGDAEQGRSWGRDQGVRGQQDGQRDARQLHPLLLHGAGSALLPRTQGRSQVLRSRTRYELCFFLFFHFFVLFFHFFIVTFCAILEQIVTSSQVLHSRTKYKICLLYFVFVLIFLISHVVLVHLLITRS